jgi:hypothetical protein
MVLHTLDVAKPSTGITTPWLQVGSLNSQQVLHSETSDALQPVLATLPQRIHPLLHGPQRSALPMV